ncbi:hypothetical protein AVEN_226540-1, partial [Araneus ventricosus]
ILERDKLRRKLRMSFGSKCPSIPSKNSKMKKSTVMVPRHEKDHIKDKKTKYYRKRQRPLSA